jgi:hypothetical protein
MRTRIQAKAATVFSTLLVTSTLPSAAQACITPRVEGTTVILQNSCNQYVSWALCIRVSGRQFDDYPVGSIAPKGSSQYGLFVDPKVPFSAELAWCEGKGCKVIQPRCSEPGRKPEQSATKPPVLFCPKDLSLRQGSDARAQDHNKLVEMCKVAFPDAADGSPKTNGADRPAAKRGEKQGPTARAGQARQSPSASSGGKQAPKAQSGQARQSPPVSSGQVMDAITLGLSAAAGAIAKQRTVRPSVAPQAASPSASTAQFACRDRRQYDACIPQYISRGLPYGYEGRDIRQVAHEYCSRNFCQ